MEIDAQCFLGSQGDLRPAGDEVVNISVNLQYKSTTWVIGKIPESAGSGSSYTCVWGLSQFNDKDHSRNLTEGRPGSGQLIDTQRVEKVESDLNHEEQQKVLKDRMNQMSEFGNGELKQSTRDGNFNPFTPYTSLSERVAGQEYNHPGDYYLCTISNPGDADCP
jgi:hypothetical protein